MSQKERKQIEGLAKQADKHTRKIQESYRGGKDSSDSTVEHWAKEIRTFLKDAWKKKD